MKSKLFFLVLGLTLVAASCNQRSTAINTQPVVSGASIEDPTTSPVVLTEPVVETPSPSVAVNTSTKPVIKTAGLSVPKTEEEQDAQIDQNTIRNVEQDSRLDNLDTKTDNLQGQINNLPVPQPVPTPSPAPNAVPISQSVKEIRFDEQIPSTINYWGDSASFNVPNPRFYIDGDLQVNNYPYKVLVDGAVVDLGKHYTTGTYNFTVTSTGFTSKSFDVTFIKKEYVEPTFSSEINGNTLHILLTSNSGPFGLYKINFHVITNTMTVAPTLVVLNGVTYKVDGDFSSKFENVFLQDDQQKDITVRLATTPTKGSFQYEVSSIEYLQEETLKKVNLNLTGPLITVE